MTANMVARLPLVKGVRDRLNRLRAAEIEAASMGDLNRAASMYRDYLDTRVAASSLADTWAANGMGRLGKLMRLVVEAV